jgi:hypothetical protein
MKLSNVRVIFNQDDPTTPKVFVEGKRMTGVLAINWDIQAGSNPLLTPLTLTVLPGIIDYRGDVTVVPRLDESGELTLDEVDPVPA